MKNLISEKLTSQLTGFHIVSGSEQRTIGDLLEYKTKNILFNLIHHDLVNECREPRSKKSIEDLSIIGTDNIIYYVDTKTHNINSEFSMPNLTSVEKLRDLLLSDNKELIYIFISYDIINDYVSIKQIEVKFLWELSFDMLRIGSLGKGQLQISDMLKEFKFTEIGKKEWFKQLKQQVNIYHDQRIKQIKKDNLKWQ